VLARQDHLQARLAEQVAQQQRDGKRHVLLLGAAAADGARVVSAVARVDHHPVNLEPQLLGQGALAALAGLAQRAQPTAGDAIARISGGAQRRERIRLRRLLARRGDRRPLFWHGIRSRRDRRDLLLFFIRSAGRFGDRLQQRLAARRRLHFLRQGGQQRRQLGGARGFGVVRQGALERSPRQIRSPRALEENVGQRQR